MAQFSWVKFNSGSVGISAASKIARSVSTSSDEALFSGMPFSYAVFISFTTSQLEVKKPFIGGFAAICFVAVCEGRHWFRQGLYLVMLLCLLVMLVMLRLMLWLILSFF